MKDIIIIGGGGHAKVIISLLKKHPDWNPVGYTDIENRGLILGVPFLGTDRELGNIADFKNTANVVIGIGHLKSIEIRKKIAEYIEKIGLNCPSVISPNAVVNEDVTIGAGTVVMDGAIIQPGTVIGDFCIINTGASVDHDCVIGNFVHLAPGVTLSGLVRVGSQTLIGAGARTIHNITICDNTIVGAGSVVIKDISEPGTYVGVPAENILFH